MTISNEYIRPKKFLIFMHGLKSAILGLDISSSSADDESSPIKKQQKNRKQKKTQKAAFKFLVLQLDQKLFIALDVY